MAHKDNKREYCVYIHTTPSNKKYVGLTSYEPEKRWRHGENYKTSRYFYNAIKKYGWENIEHEIVATGLSWDDASKEEQRLIALYKTNDTDYGYNRTSGGEDGFHHDKETICKISEASKRLWGDDVHREAMIERVTQRWNERPDLKEALSEQSKARWSQRDYRDKMLLAINAYNNNPVHKAEQSRRAKKLWDNAEYRRKMTARMRGENNPSAKMVSQYTITGVYISTFKTCKDAAKAVGLKNSSNICACANGHVKTAGGYIWRYTDGK